MHTLHRNCISGLRLFILGTALSAYSASAQEKIQIGDLTVGGAIRANYVLGDYVKDDSGAPQRGGNGGDFLLDTFRINLNYEKDAFSAVGEYRWYNGYNFIHTAYVGYALSEQSELQVGINRVPFGVGPYGPANSWFFDQHYYVGLSDDMDTGIKYTHRFDNMTLDVAAYFMPTPEGQGASSRSARYSYDVVDEDSGGFPGPYRERGQINLRGIYHLEEHNTDLGASAQWGRLDARDDRADNTDAYAFSVHSNTTLGAANVKLQYTRYDYNPDYNENARVSLAGDRDIAAPNDLIMMGAYDFAWPVASKGDIYSAAVSYTIIPDIDWIDSLTFYNDFSVIRKDGSIDGMSFNDSTLNVTGVAIARGGWYIYVDYAYSNGNYFIGNEGDDYSDITGIGDFGVNGNDSWNGRFNINFGYYF